MTTNAPTQSIIIIGGGLAGLSAGCFARMNGYKTRIFEMHNLPGGLCTSWWRQGYTFDGCIHWLMGSRTGDLHDIYEQLGATQGVQMVDFDEHVRVEGPEGRTWIVHTDLGRLEEHMKDLSPQDAAVTEELCSAARTMMRSEMPWNKPMELFGTWDKLKMLKLLPTLGALKTYTAMSTQDFAARFKDPFLRDVFPFLLDSMPGFSMMGPLSALACLHERNGGWPSGGSLAFAKRIERRYLSLGGEINYGARVEKILVESGRAVGIQLDDGTEHRADVVIGACDGRTLIFDMLDGKYMDDSIRAAYDGWPIYKPFIQISFGVARDLGSEPHSVIFHARDAIDVGGDRRHWLHLRHFGCDPSMAPPGKSVLTVSFMNASYSHWKELQADPDRYRSQKQRLADEVLDCIEIRFPGIKEQVEIVDVATPTTYERFTGNREGSYMGWAHSVDLMSESMNRTLPGLDGFLLAGQWLLRGNGVPGSITSGRHAIQVICKKDKKRFVATQP